MGAILPYQGEASPDVLRCRYLKVPLPLSVAQKIIRVSSIHPPSSQGCEVVSGRRFHSSAVGREQVQPLSLAATPSVCRSRSVFPSGDSGRDLDQLSLNSRKGLQVECLAADTRSWPLTAAHDRREPDGEWRITQIGCELHFILLEWLWR